MIHDHYCTSLATCKLSFIHKCKPTELGTHILRTTSTTTVTESEIPSRFHDDGGGSVIMKVARLMIPPLFTVAAEIDTTEHEEKYFTTPPIDCARSTYPANVKRYQSSYLGDKGGGGAPVVVECT
jgi:hypothetical protein